MYTYIMDRILMNSNNTKHVLKSVICISETMWAHLNYSLFIILVAYLHNVVDEAQDWEQ